MVQLLICGDSGVIDRNEFEKFHADSNLPGFTLELEQGDQVRQDVSGDYLLVDLCMTYVSPSEKSKEA